MWYIAPVLPPASYCRRGSTHEQQLTLSMHVCMLHIRVTDALNNGFCFQQLCIEHPESPNRNGSQTIGGTPLACHNNTQWQATHSHSHMTLSRQAVQAVHICHILSQVNRHDLLVLHFSSDATPQELSWGSVTWPYARVVWKHEPVTKNTYTDGVHTFRQEGCNRKQSCWQQLIWVTCHMPCAVL